MANVRIWGYRAVVQLNQRQTQFFNSDSQFVREEPYLWASGPIALNGAVPVESAVQGSDKAMFVVVEVDDNAAVRYEVNPNGPLASNHRVASANSPRLRGENLFQWFSGATMSFIDAAGT